jgi:cysteine desulfurase
MNKFIYLDHAATTYIKNEVFEEMKPYFYNSFGNASSIYQLGRYSKKAIENSHKKVASALNCQPEEIFFTSCGTESDNWAIKGMALANRFKGNHIITSSIEHPAVKKSCEYLESIGFEVTYLPVDEFGVVSLEQLKASIKESTILITIMFANNEVGTIQPIKEIGEIAKEHGVPFHTDAVQAVGNIEINVDAYNIDLLSLSAHKFYGPKGIGALYIRNGTYIDPFLHGGSQERSKRSGTENVAAIVGLGKAIELATNDIENKNAKITRMRNGFIQDILNTIPHSHLNGHPTKRLPGNANIAFGSINAKFLTSVLDKSGIYVSSGSACSCKSNAASHVLLAMKKTEDIAFSSVRFTFGEENTKDEVN